MPARISVNGTSKGSGHSISISGGKMVVDGQEFDLGADQQITIDISGDVVDLIVGACEQVRIEGSISPILLGSLRGTRSLGQNRYERASPSTASLPDQSHIRIAGASDTDGRRSTKRSVTKLFGG